MIADESNIIYNNQTTGLPDWSNKSIREYFRQKYLSVQKIQTIEYIFLELNTSDKRNGSQNNLKNQTINTTFLKSDEGKSCLIPDNPIQPRWKFNIRGYIWFLVDFYVLILRPRKQIINRTFSVQKCVKQYLPINLVLSGNKDQFRNQISSFTICIFKMALHVKINIENVRTFKTKKSEIICSDHVDIFLNY